MIRFDLHDNSTENGWMQLQFPMDCDESGVTLKKDNPWWRFCDVKLGRTVEFSVPATDYNKRLLRHGEDAAMYGEALRAKLEAQMVYDGGCVQGMIEITGYNGDAFTCVFREGDSEWIDSLQDRNLNDCMTTLKGVVWSQSTHVYDASEQNIPDIAIVNYYNGLQSMPAGWQLLPSVRIKAMIHDYLSNLGIDDSVAMHEYPEDLRLVMPTLNAGTATGVTITAGAGDAGMTITQQTPILYATQVPIEWATAMVFGAYVGGGQFPAWVFTTYIPVKMAFPMVFPSNLFLIKWDSRLRRCKCLGRDLAGKTIDLAGNTSYFFSLNSGEYMSAGMWYGWQKTAATDSGYSVTVEVARDAQLAYGDTWEWKYNVPNMTIFGMLKAAALSAGLELEVDAVAKSVAMRQAGYGYDGNQRPDVRQLGNVIAVEEVSRRVGVWGAATGKAEIAFDSEDYVSIPLKTEYDIDNAQLTGVKTVKIPWSEGESDTFGAGGFGTVIRDVMYDGSTPTLAANKATVAKTGLVHLTRVDAPQMRGYDDIATNSTILRVKAAYPVGELVSLQPRTTYVWRGIMYVWTEATWTDGVLSLTLQKVSQIQPK